MLIEENFVEVRIANRVTESRLSALVTAIGLIGKVEQLVRVVRALPNYSAIICVDILLRKPAAIIFTTRG